MTLARTPIRTARSSALTVRPQCLLQTDFGAYLWNSDISDILFTKWPKPFWHKKTLVSLLIIIIILQRAGGQSILELLQLQLTNVASLTLWGLVPWVSSWLWTTQRFFQASDGGLGTNQHSLHQVCNEILDVWLYCSPLFSGQIPGNCSPYLL